ncbi:unnamed protein product [Parnassius apollo]|uniref:(apollo) hypothetical protein n=1 Tax=Parnassius apollo TaxID=110799 RepID=A0A8S3WDI1_PARAO|nr:unnamed protein product [Parnassius apollo]
MAYLNDDVIDNELEQMFGLPDNPDESEDEYECDDSLVISLGIRALTEDPNIIQNQGSPTPGPSRRSPVSFLSSNDGEIRENININIGVHNFEYNDSKGEEILRPVRPSQISRTISESSTDSPVIRMKMIEKKVVCGWTGQMQINMMKLP